jgi:hypothetical protein
MRWFVLSIFLAVLISCGPSRQKQLESEIRQPSKIPIRLSFEREISGRLLGYELKHPSGVALDRQGNLYIADAGNHRILKLNSALEPIKDYGGYGGGVGRLSNPSDIVVDRGLNVYLLDCGNRRVVQLDINLNYVDEVIPEDDPKAIVANQGLLTGLVLSPMGEIIVADYDNSRLIRMDNFRRFESYIGDFGYGSGALQNPLGISADGAGRMYVADAGNRRIAVYDDYGNYLMRFGDDTLKTPSAVETGPNNLVWVVDRQLNAVLAFSHSGKLLFGTGGTGRDDNTFTDIEALAVSPDSLLYIADSGNNRVMVYRIIYGENQ